MTDANAQVLWWRDQTPFGQTVTTGGFSQNPLRFPGQIADAESGLAYNYFRDYDPALGRYIQSDPIGLGGGLNTYGYVRGRPVNRVDPFGLWSTKAHKKFINDFFRGKMSAEEIDSVVKGSRDTDSYEHQDAEDAYMHAMSSSSLSSNEACMLMNKFIKENIERFNKYSEHEALGRALHAAMDFTSPAHGDGKGTFPKWSFFDAYKHGPFPTSIEDVGDIDAEHLGMTLNAMQKAMNGEALCDCSNLD